MKYAFTFLLFFSATASLSSNANAQFCEGKYYTHSQSGIPAPTVDYQGVRYRISAKSSEAGMRTMVEGSVSGFNVVTSTLEKPVPAVQLDEKGKPSAPLMETIIVERLEYIQSEEHRVGGEG